MSIDNYEYVVERMQNGTGCPNITMELTLVSIHANEQTLSVYLILYVICRCYHNSDSIKVAPTTRKEVYTFM